MNSKWFFGTLMLLLGFLGVRMEHTAVSNQEIVVQFSDTVSVQDESQKAIAEVQDRLLEAGVENIRITQLADGDLKITYYSDLGIGEIQKIFSEANLTTDLPAEKDDPYSEDTWEISKNYKLDIYEILSQPEGDIDFEGALLDSQLAKEYFLVPTGVGTNRWQQIEFKSVGENKATSIVTREAHIPLHYPYFFPEVRAGPSA